VAEKTIIKDLLKLDKTLLFCTLFLTFFGCVMIYSASSYSAELTYGDSFFFARKQLISVLIGIITMLLISRVDYNIFKKYGIASLIISLILLALVFIPAISISKYGATRWIGFGGFSIQPSEIAKFGFVLFCAWYFDKYFEKIGNFKYLLPPLLAGGAVCALIMLEPNMSITMCVGLTMMFMLYIGGTRLKHFALLGVPTLAIIPALIIAEPYRMKRMLAFLDPWANSQNEGFQLVQSLYSLGAGGLFGVGLFNSRQKYLFLPFSESDFIFSIIGEELGLVGCVAIIIIFFLLIKKGFQISMHAPNKFGCFLGSGITCIIAVQVLLNIAVVIGAVPPTGLPLPFVSAGGTSIVVFMSAIGVLMNIKRQSESATQQFYSMR